MARPKPSEPTVVVSARIPERVRDALLAAAPEGTSLAAAVASACEAALAGNGTVVGPRAAVARAGIASTAAGRGAVKAASKAEACSHPIGRRMNGTCLVCYSAVVK